MYLSKSLCLSSVAIFFRRGLTGLRAALLNQQVVVTGGKYDGNVRDEVLCGILYLIMRSFFGSEIFLPNTAIISSEPNQAW